MPDPEPTRCAQPSCGCASTHVESAYCSAYCANLGYHDGDETELPESACACGHAACIAAQRVDRATGEVATAIGGGPGREQTE